MMCLALWIPARLHGAQDNAKHSAASTFEERQAAEKTSRSQYRNLEVASFVLIIVAGGAAILWAVRRK